jgi:hypothetical protein
MDEYKKKVEENATICAAIKTDDNGAGLFSEAFPYAAKTLRCAIDSFWRE